MSGSCDNWGTTRGDDPTPWLGSATGGAVQPQGWDQSKGWTPPLAGQPGRGMNRIRVVARSTIYQGRTIRLIREVLQTQGRRMVRETVQHPGAVVIVPVLGRSRMVFVRQYRRAVGRTLLELPAGTLEPGERKEACARRELQEETGWKAGRLRRIGQFYAAPGFISEQLTIFLAQDLTPVPARPEPDELVEPVILPLRAALQRIKRGAICDAKTIIGVLFAERLLEPSRGVV